MGTAFSILERPAPLLMTSVFFGCASVLSAPALADAVSDRLDEVSRIFAKATVISGPTAVPCRLSGGTQATCFSITVSDDPEGYTPGPWCPRGITDGAAAGGIWLHEGRVHDVDGAFVAGLGNFYADDRWQLFDPETGAVRFTGTLKACAAAARPDVAPEYQNTCVECLPEYIPDEATITYVIPLEPGPPIYVFPTRMSGAGVAHNGVRLDAPAPVDAILRAHTIAPFDDCGGHVNLHIGYHYHAVTDCLNDGPASNLADHGQQIGIAMDGYPIVTHLMADGSEPGDLDRCNGHIGADGAYHYHAGTAGSNAILACLRAETGCTLNDPEASCDATTQRQRP